MAEDSSSGSRADNLFMQSCPDKFFPHNLRARAQRELMEEGVGNSGNSTPAPKAFDQKPSAIF